MFELIAGAIASLIAILGGKLWLDNRKFRKLEEKINGTTIAEMAHIEKAKLNIAAAKKTADNTKPDSGRRDFESD